MTSHPVTVAKFIKMKFLLYDVYDISFENHPNITHMHQKLYSGLVALKSSQMSKKDLVLLWYRAAVNATTHSRKILHISQPSVLSIMATQEWRFTTRHICIWIKWALTRYESSSVSLFVRKSVRLSVCLFVCLSVCLHVWLILSQK